MKYLSRACLGVLAAAAALPATAYAQEESSDGITISGEATLVSDYRFRGFSQSNEKAAIQGGFTITHDSGFYVGTWGSSIGFGNGTEIDAFAGFGTELGSGISADAGVNFYFYPGVSDSTIVEPYASLTGEVGPASLTAGVAWAPGGQDSLGDASAIYLYGDVGIAIPDTPFTLNGHLGYAKSDSALGGFDGKVLDYSIGVSASWKALTASVSYINTNEPKALGWKEAVGADGAVVFTLGVAF